MARAFITELGTTLRVDEPWFYRACHSFVLTEAFGIKVDRSKIEKTVIVFPTDTVFKVERLYMKRNQKSSSSVTLKVERSPISNIRDMQFSVNIADFNAARLTVDTDVSVGGDGQEHRGDIIDGEGLKKLRKKRIWNRLWVEATYDDESIGHVAGAVDVHLGHVYHDSVSVRIDDMAKLGVPYFSSRINDRLSLKSEQTEFRREVGSVATNGCTLSFYHISREAPR